MYILTKYSFCFSARLTTCINSIIDSTGIKLYVFVVRNKGQSYLFRRRSSFLQSPLDITNLPFQRNLFGIERIRYIISTLYTELFGIYIYFIYRTVRYIYFTNQTQ